MHVADRTWPELAEYDGTLALVPMGSTEQHGPHLPTGTDHIIARELARAAADRTGYLCTPVVSIAASAHHRQFPGTLWVDAPVFRDYVESLTRNLAYHGIDRVVYVNAHGGNVQHLREVGRRLREDETAYAIEWMWDESIPDLVDDLFEYNGPHGGPKETAMIQHLEPELVREDRLADARDGGVRDMAAFAESDSFVHGARTFYDTVDNSANGVFGDQTDATGEKGAELFAAATDQLVSLAEWLATREFEALMPKGRVTDGST
jgi:creatinine amidohydrolase